PVLYPSLDAHNFKNTVVGSRQQVAGSIEQAVSTLAPALSACCFCCLLFLSIVFCCLLFLSAVSVACCSAARHPRGLFTARCLLPSAYCRLPTARSACTTLLACHII